MRPAWRASARCWPRCCSGTRGPRVLQALAAFGGFEIATLVGAVLQAAAERRVIVVDGFISSAAVLVAKALQPSVTQRCVFSHRSDESGHALMATSARWRDAPRALLDLGLRLGEGSGAVLAWPLLQSACAILAEMASFESAGVSEQQPSAAPVPQVNAGAGQVGWLRHYLLALQFFTRVPVTGRLARWVGFTPAMLRASAAPFPASACWSAGSAAGAHLLLLDRLPLGPWPFMAAAFSTIARCCSPAHCTRTGWPTWPTAWAARRYRPGTGDHEVNILGAFGWWP